MLFDLTGTRHDTPGTMKQINLTGFGVIGEDGADLQPEDNPHNVSDTFALSLIASGRAVEHDPDAAVTKAPTTKKKP